jgi:hypothetical protein
LVLTVGCNSGFEDQGGGQLDFGPAATLAFLILVRTIEPNMITPDDKAGVQWC